MLTTFCPSYTKLKSFCTSGGPSEQKKGGGGIPTSVAHANKRKLHLSLMVCRRVCAPTFVSVSVCVCVYFAKFECKLGCADRVSSKSGLGTGKLSHVV